jgi:hypothetical protein
MDFDIEFTEEENRKLKAMAERAGVDVVDVVAWILTLMLDMEWVPDPFEQFIASRREAA